MINCRNLDIKSRIVFAETTAYNIINLILGKEKTLLRGVATIQDEKEQMLKAIELMGPTRENLPQFLILGFGSDYKSSRLELMEALKKALEVASKKEQISFSDCKQYLVQFLETGQTDKKDLLKKIMDCTLNFIYSTMPSSSDNWLHSNALTSL